jgi:DNA-binding IclR family transcriptional regulator
VPPRDSKEIGFTRRTQAVQRAVEILKLFSLAEPDLALQTIADRLGLSAATTHRLLQTLDDEGLLSRIPATDLYRLGPLLPSLSAQMIAQYPVRRLAAPYVQRLAHELRASVALSRFDHGEVLYLDCVVEGPSAVVLAIRTGARLPAHCVASGRALLAYTWMGRRLNI